MTRVDIAAQRVFIRIWKALTSVVSLTVLNTVCMNRLPKLLK